MNHLRAPWAAWLLLVVLGCGAPSAPDRSNAQADFNAATEAFDQGNFAQAMQHYDAVVESVGLNPDQMAETYIRRAVCRAHTGDMAGAHADLDFMAEGGPTELVYSARAFVLRAEGRTSEAASMLAKARQLDRNVEVFDK